VRAKEKLVSSGMDSLLNVLQPGLDQFVGRLSGPLNFRLVVMPTVVTVLALRAAWKDHQDGRPAFLGLLIKDPVERSRLFQQGLKNIGRIFIVAIVLDIAYQLMVFRWVYPGMVLVVAVVCAIVPYVLVRGPLYLFVHFLLRKARREGSSHVQPKQEKK
jgi:hypothetical protein